jgi:chemotaxis methyl-accepting protein methylase
MTPNRKKEPFSSLGRDMSVESIERALKAAYPRDEVMAVVGGGRTRKVVPSVHGPQWRVAAKRSERPARLLGRPTQV